MENENEKKTADTAVKKKPDMDKLTELIIVIMLGVTALLTAWASWIGSLHGGNQATNYATSNNLASEGNSEYNAGVQQMNQGEKSGCTEFCAERLQECDEPR